LLMVMGSMYNAAERLGKKDGGDGVEGGGMEVREEEGGGGEFCHFLINGSYGFNGNKIKRSTEKKRNHTSQTG